MIKQIRLSALLVITTCFLMFSNQMGSFADDPGVGWHLKDGEVISNTLEIPKTDPFLVHQGEPRKWISDQWLSDLILFQLKQYGDWQIIYTVIGCIYLLTFFYIVAPGTAYQIGANIPALIAAAFAFKVGELHLILRPVVFSIFFFSIVHYITRRLANGLVSRSEEFRYITYLFGLFVLWANLHPAFVLGLVLVVISVIARCIETKKIAKLIVLLPVICFAATLCNPYGLDLHRSILQLGRSDFFMNLNREWLSPDLRSLEVLYVALMVLVPPVVFILVKNDGYKMRVFDLLSVIFFLLQSIFAVRFLPFLGIVAVPVFALALARISYIRWESYLPTLRLTVRFLKGVENSETQGSMGKAPAIVFSLALVICSCVSKKVPFYGGEVGPSYKKYHYQALDHLNSQVDDGVVLSSPDWGGFITLMGFPRFRAVIDDRNTLLGEEIYLNFFESMTSQEKLKRMIEDFSITHILTKADSVLAKRLRDETSWMVVYEDPLTALFRVGAM